MLSTIDHVELDSMVIEQNNERTEEVKMANVLPVLVGHLDFFKRSYQRDFQLQSKMLSMYLIDQHLSLWWIWRKCFCQGKFSKFPIERETEMWKAGVERIWLFKKQLDIDRTNREMTDKMSIDQQILFSFHKHLHHSIKWWDRHRRFHSSNTQSFCSTETIQFKNFCKSNRFIGIGIRMGTKAKANWNACFFSLLTGDIELF